MGRQDKLDPTHFLPVAEKFISVNGEGTRSGQPCAFVRFVGCDLCCSWCDTRWACDQDCEREWMDSWEIAEWVASTGVHCVTLTGGEPLLHPIIGDLLRMLVAGKGSRSIPFELPEDLRVEVETSGAVALSRFQTLLRFLPKSQSERIVFTVDYKLPSSGMEDRMVSENYSMLRPHDVVKFVVADRNDLDRMRQVIEMYDLHGRFPVFVSPVKGAIEPGEIAQYLIDEGLMQVRLQLQLHKILWPGQDRGV